MGPGHPQLGVDNVMKQHQERLGTILLGSATASQYLINIQRLIYRLDCTVAIRYNSGHPRLLDCLTDPDGWQARVSLGGKQRSAITRVLVGLALLEWLVNPHPLRAKSMDAWIDSS